MSLRICTKTIRLLYGALIIFALGEAAQAETLPYAKGLSTGPIPDSTREIANIYFAPANKKTLAVVYNQSVIGRADVYSHIGITLLPVSELAPMLGLSINVDAEDGVAQGMLPDGRHVMLIPAKNTVLIDGEEQKQVPGLMFVRDDDVYIDSSVFVNIFSLTVYVDYRSNTLRIESADGKKVETLTPAPQKPKPVETAVTPVIVQELDGAKTSPATSASEPEEEALVLQLVVDDITMEEFVEGFRRGDKLYLPLTQLVDLIDFAIKVDPANKSASGWFIREENTFSLSADSVTVNGETTALPAGSLISKDRDLFVDSDLLQRWFPLDFLMDRYAMTLALYPRQALPFQERIALLKRRDGLKRNAKPEKDVTYKTIDYPYEAASVPFVNLTFSPSYQSQNHQSRADYSILATGDVAYMTGHLYAGGDLNERAFTDLRLTLGRVDYDRNLLGFAHASSFSLGDINSIGLSQVAQASSGRGVTVSNRSPDRSDKFDVTSFIGDGTPGWEAELYRNNVLINSQTIGADGRYNFTDVPILFGNNTFRLVFFGPQGQVDEIVKNINASAALLEEGQFTYNFSADQKNRTLFNVADGSAQDTGERTVGELEYGINRWLTVTLGGARTVLDDKVHNYATSGIRTSLGGVLMSVDGAYDVSDKSYSTRLAMFANYFDTNFNFQQRFASDFLSEEGGTTTNPIKSLTEFGFDRQTVLPVIGEFNTGLSWMRREFENGRLNHIWLNRLSKSVYGINFTNSLRYDYDNLDSENMNGSLAVRGFYDRLLLGGQLDYNIKPESEISAIKLTGSYPIMDNISGQTSVLKNLQGDRRAELENSVTFNMDKYRVSFIGRADNDSNYYIGASLNLSFGKIPDSDTWMFSGQNLAETGTVVVQPYLDRNYNQQRDEGEDAPADVAFKIGSQTLKNNGDGMLVASALPTNQMVGVHLDSEKQQNPFWTTGVDEYRVVPRSGAPVMLEYPLFETSQIDGTVNVETGSANGLKVELVDTEGQVVGITRTAFDGYYLLQGVMPGAYTIRVAEESLAENNLRQLEEKTVTVKESDFFTKDISLVSSH